jgi:hypothetical protein
MSRPSEVEHVLVDTFPSDIDPLRSNVAFPHSTVLYPLGFPLQLESNSESIIQAARESWAQFPPAFDEPPVRLSLGVSGYGGECPPPPVFLSREHLLSIVSDSGNSLMCDLAQGFGFGWVTEWVAAARPFLRYHFLDAAVLTMVGELYLTPVHGGLVERHGHGILLCGQSFAGKSTLTYACARSGWTLISDDGTFLVRRRRDRYGIGNPYSIRFREDARIFFPELRSKITARRPNGRDAIEVATSELAGIVTKLGSTIDHVVFLNRHATGSPRLATLSKSEALERMLEDVPHFGPESVREEHLKAHRRLLTGGVWQLNYSNLPDAIDCLEQLAGTSE